jgi:hypothetical protein
MPLMSARPLTQPGRRRSDELSRFVKSLSLRLPQNTTSPALYRQRGRSDVSNGAGLQAIDQRGHWSTDLVAGIDGSNEEATPTVFADLTPRTQEMRRT